MLTYHYGSNPTQVTVSDPNSSRAGSHDTHRTC